VTRFGSDTRKGVVVSQAALDRVRANTDLNLISLDGTDYPVKAEVAAFVDALIKNKGIPEGFGNIAKRYPLLTKKHADRLWAKFPQEFQRLVEGGPGQGYRLRVEDLE